MDDRRWTIDFGAFPDFTDQHFLSLTYVLPHLVENQQKIVREIELALPALAGDSEATALVAETLVGESQASASCNSWPASIRVRLPIVPPNLAAARLDRAPL